MGTQPHTEKVRDMRGIHRNTATFRKRSEICAGYIETQPHTEKSQNDA